ncbi:MAG: hypothetical protein GWM98_00830, partial [Nitrospinaceae bacterium]|nr:hypothetical protein [Nitrospinaceae bacterium]NIR53320.1 hypothetical protein [Nitrospinaceae bacterium]NIS83718.1 hypothetical protein [Nitrospinaceae bacterium]NIT80516.1 hypothetical protein [Nitrospinaceae bacterium]NIU42842.1 hypothetical protein [Nitrospinaceae bacterium]
MVNKNTLIKIAGGFWVVIGVFLMIRGGNLYQLALQEQQATQLALAFSLIAGLVLGSVKARLVLSKTARKNKRRIQNLSPPTKWHHIFPKPFYGFIALMVLLGISLRNFNGYLGGYLVVAA